MITALKKEVCGKKLSTARWKKAPTQLSLSRKKAPAKISLSREVYSGCALHGGRELNQDGDEAFTVNLPGFC